ncbi:hypothetical protein KY325_02550 [Candidatus Woesearchaeota archaeon]|nr:hypothetical protein [Candidatus Woesearchaeota archaeon]MBW3018014.1 hypothetical protein [Candidatus Woesearchaeota archaeon]
MTWKRGEEDNSSMFGRFKSRLKNTFVFDYISHDQGISKRIRTEKAELKAEKSSNLRKFLENKRNLSIMLAIVVVLALGIPTIIYRDNIGAAIFEQGVESNRVETLPPAIGDDDPGAGGGTTIPEIPGTDDSGDAAAEPVPEEIVSTGFGRGTNRGSSSTSGSSTSSIPPGLIGKKFFASFFGLFSYFKDGMEVFAEDTSFTTNSWMQVRKDSTKLVDFQALFENVDVNLSELNIEYNETQIAVDFSNIPSGHVGDAVSLYLPDNGTGLYFCPNVTTLSQVNINCGNVIVFNQTEIEAGTTKDGVTASTDGNYYRIDYT